MSKLDEYRTAMIARKAAARGMTVEAFLAASEREALEQRVWSDARYCRPFQQATIARRAAERGNTWAVGS